MKTKTYEFTKDEVCVLRSALDAYYFQHITGRTFEQPLWARLSKLVHPLLEQFKDDYRLWK